MILNDLKVGYTISYKTLDSYEREGYAVYMEKDRLLNKIDPLSDDASWEGDRDIKRIKIFNNEYYMFVANSICIRINDFLDFVNGKPEVTKSKFGWKI